MLHNNICAKKDLSWMTIVDNHTISTKWEERIWRDLISLREENIKAVAPDFYLKDNSNRINAV